MPEESIGTLSRLHVDHFLSRERQGIELLKREAGSEVVGKLDRIVLRDLLYERKNREFAALIVDDSETPVPRHLVMLNMQSGVLHPSFQAPPDRRKRRQAVAKLRRSGERAVGRILPDVREHGAEVRATFWLTHSVLIEATGAQLLQLASRHDVASVNHTKEHLALCLDVSRPLIGADAVAVSGFDGSGVDVAVLDTGVDFTHAALSAVTGVQLDFTGEGTGDLHGHGSHCAGIVASQDKKFRGVAPGCTVHDYKVLNNMGSANSANCVTAIQQAVADGRDVLSNSWGFSHANGAWVCAAGDCVLCQAANAAAAAGVVFVVAAGNEDNDSCSTYDTHLRCPGHATDAITVAASDDGDDIADFSSIGPAADGRAKPDITAPGVDIISMRATTGSDMNGQATVIDGSFAQVSGTSQATPHIAGVCALMLDKNRDLRPAVIKGILMATAVDIGEDPEEMGAGRVDAQAAVNAS